MPAFVLKYIVDHEVRALEIDFINHLMAVFTFTKAISALALISDVSRAQKIYIGFEAVKSSLELLATSSNLQKELNLTEAGRVFLKHWNTFQFFDDGIGGIGSVTKIFNNDTFWMFSEMSSAWDVVSKQSIIGEYLDVSKVTDKINKLKTTFNEAEIVF
jgi:hypothetical protein